MAMSSFHARFVAPYTFQAPSFQLEIAQTAPKITTTSATAATSSVATTDCLGTGATVWPCSELLARHLTRGLRSSVVGKRCLELGSGGGLAGLAAAAIGAARVTLTDLDAMLPLLEANARRNSGCWMFGGLVLVRSLPWGDATAMHSLIAEIGQVDVVLCSDLAFLPAHVDLLVGTLCSILAANPDVEILWAQERHNPLVWSQIRRRLREDLGMQEIVIEGGSALDRRDVLRFCRGRRARESCGVREGEALLKKHGEKTDKGGSGGVLWAQRWIESGMASTSFRKMVTAEGELHVLPDLWDLVKSFTIPSDAIIRACKRMWARRYHCGCTFTGGTRLGRCITPEGLIVTGSGDNTAKVWAQEGKCLHTLDGHTNYVTSVAVTPEGLIVTGSADHTAKVWTQEGKCLQTLTGGHDYPIFAVAVTPEGLIVTGSMDDTAMVWTREGECLHTLKGHESGVFAVAVMPEGLIVTGSDDCTAKVWTQWGECLHTLRGHDKGLLAVAVTPEGLIVTGSADCTAKLWTREGECLHTLEGHKSYISSVAIMPKGLIVTGSGDNTAKMWTQEGECLHTLMGHSNLSFNGRAAISTLAVTSEGLIVIGMGDGTTKVWTR